MFDEMTSGGDSSADVLGAGRTVIEVKRSGGTVGRTITFGVDSIELAPAQATRLDALLERSSYDDVPDSSDDLLDGRSRGADRFQYELTISTGSTRRHCRFAEGSPAYDRYRDLIAFAVDATRAGHDTEGKDS